MGSEVQGGESGGDAEAPPAVQFHFTIKNDDELWGNRTIKSGILVIPSFH